MQPNRNPPAKQRAPYAGAAASQQNQMNRLQRQMQPDQMNACYGPNSTQQPAQPFYYNHPHVQDESVSEPFTHGEYSNNAVPPGVGGGYPSYAGGNTPPQGRGKMPARSGGSHGQMRSTGGAPGAPEMPMQPMEQPMPMEGEMDYMPPMGSDDHDASWLSAQSCSMSTSLPNLHISPRDFPPIWNEITQGCDVIFNWSMENSTFRKQVAINHVMRLYTLVYHVVSNECTNCPALVRMNNTNDPVEGKDKLSSQVLVVYYLIREMLRTRVQDKVIGEFRKAVEMYPPIDGKKGDDYTPPELPDRPSSPLLAVYLEQWEKFFVALMNLTTVFSYVHAYWNRFGLPPDHTVLPTETLGLMMWMESLPHIKLYLREELVRLINRDRMGKPIDTVQVKTVLQSIAMLNNQRHSMYSEVFENMYLRRLSESIPHTKIENLSRTEFEVYMQETLDRCIREEDRARRLLLPVSEDSVNRQTITPLVDVPSAYLEARITDWYTSTDYDHMRLLLTLMMRSPTQGLTSFLTAYRAVVQKHVRQHIMETVVEAPAYKNSWNSTETWKQQEAGVAFVTATLEEYKRNAYIVDCYYDGKKEMHDVVADAIRSVLGSTAQWSDGRLTGVRVAESLAQRLHYLLKDPKNIQAANIAHNVDSTKASAAKQVYDEVTFKLNDMVAVFPLFQEVGKFREMYSILLCKRLLRGTFSKTLETLMIRSLSVVSGGDFVHRWNICLKDSTELANRWASMFHNYCTNHRDEYNAVTTVGSVWELQPLVITPRAWSAFCQAAGQDSLELPTRQPACLRNMLHMFTKLHSSYYPRRNLTFVQALSDGVVQMNVPAHVRQSVVQASAVSITVSEPQLLIFELINNPTKTKWTFREIRDFCLDAAEQAQKTSEERAIGMQILRASLQPFVEYNILLHEPSNKKAPSANLAHPTEVSYTPDDVFVLNPNRGIAQRRLQFQRSTAAAFSMAASSAANTATLATKTVLGTSKSTTERQDIASGPLLTGTSASLGIGAPTEPEDVQHTEEEMQSVILATIVRTMKKAGSAPHADVMHMISQDPICARWKPTIQEIKLTIDKALEKEILSRTDEPDVLEYMP